MSKESSLNPGETKRQAIIESATALFRDLLGSHIDEACADAAESFTRDEEATEPAVKLAFALSFVPTHEAPELNVSVAWSVRRKDEATATIDPTQYKLPLAKEGAS